MKPQTIQFPGKGVPSTLNIPTPTPAGGPVACLGCLVACLGVPVAADSGVGVWFESLRATFLLRILFNAPPIPVLSVFLLLSVSTHSHRLRILLPLVLNRPEGLRTVLPCFLGVWANAGILQHT